MRDKAKHEYSLHAGPRHAEDSRYGLQRERPDKKQLDAMRALAKEGMEDGAFGITSGLIYPPGSYADADELAYVISALRPTAAFTRRICATRRRL